MYSAPNTVPQSFDREEPRIVLRSSSKILLCSESCLKAWLCITSLLLMLHYNLWVSSLIGWRSWELGHEERCPHLPLLFQASSQPWARRRSADSTLATVTIYFFCVLLRYKEDSHKGLGLLAKGRVCFWTESNTSESSWVFRSEIDHWAPRSLHRCCTP